jgi:hypothetical protein
MGRQTQWLRQSCLTIQTSWLLAQVLSGDKNERAEIMETSNRNAHKTRTFESDLNYPHGKLAVKILNSIDGHLLALQYTNAAGLGRALSALGGIVFWLPPENDRAVIWLDAEFARRLPRQFAERLSYLAQFEVTETKRTCDRCKNKDVLYAGGKYGYPVRLLCFKCSRLLQRPVTKQWQHERRPRS